MLLVKKEQRKDLHPPSTSLCYIPCFLDVDDSPPSDPCPTDLDRILTEGQDPGAQQYLVLGTVPIKGKKPGVLGAHAFFVLSTVPIKKKRLQVKPKANKLYKEALEQCNHNNHVSKFI